MPSLALLLGVYNANIGIDTKNKCTILSFVTLLNSLNDNIKIDFNNRPAPYAAKLVASAIVNVGMYYLGMMFKPKRNTYP